MANIGGNITGIFKVKHTKKNSIGESVAVWQDACDIVGWLSLQSGDSKYTNFNAKLEESSHIFLCDFDEAIYALAEQDTRMSIKGKMYDVLLIDNPDERDEQLEIYLRRVGAANG